MKISNLREYSFIALCYVAVTITRTEFPKNKVVAFFYKIYETIVLHIIALLLFLLTFNIKN
jgi:hypothetical protein